MLGVQISATSRKDIDDIINSIVGGPKSQTGVDSSDFTPSSSIPGTPSMHPASLPAQTTFGSGRLSRQSDFYERASIAASTLVGTTSSATDHVIER